MMTNIAMQEDGWCILRMSGPRTLSVAASLADAGYEVWTPARLISQRLPRSKKRVERSIAILPTFVFAHARHEADLLRESKSLVSRHPRFSVFHYLGRVPLVSETDIAGARAEEAKWLLAEKKRQRPAFPIGQRVRVKEGIATGMTGIVTRPGGEFALVLFGDREMKIASWLLAKEQIENCYTQSGVTAGAVE